MKAPTAHSLRLMPSNQAYTHRYILFVNSERLGSYLLLSDLMTDLKTKSGQIKIQKIHVPTNTHTFTSFIREVNHD